MKTSISCQTCGQGTMNRKSVYRLSGCIALAGYVLLLPSVIGFLWSGFLLLTAGTAAGSISPEMVKQSKADARADMEAAAVPEDLVLMVLNSDPIEPSDTAGLTQEQTDAINSGKTMVAAAVVGTASVAAAAGILGAASVATFVASLLGAVVGWILILKKKILQCGSCQAVIAAS